MKSEIVEIRCQVGHHRRQIQRNTQRTPDYEGFFSKIYYVRTSKPDAHTVVCYVSGGEAAGHSGGFLSG
jgi:hypothetical protein